MPERHVLLHPLGHRLGVADQRRAGAAAHQADAGPEIGADLELVAPAAVQPAHALLADRIHAGEHGLRLGDARLVDMRDQPVGRGPGLGRGLADDDVQADAEAELAAARGRRLPRLLDLERPRRPAGSPQVR